MDIELNNKWILWSHNNKNDWTINGYKKMYEISSVYEFWKIYNNWDKLGGLTKNNLFLMKENIIPIWEDENNINGGCWSFKNVESNAYELWEDLSCNLVTDNLCPTISNEIVGLSIALKKNNNIIIKIWNINSKNNSLKFINSNILSKWGTNIIYSAHVPNTT
jgi:hypothetical protein